MGRIHYIIIGLFLVAGCSLQVQGQSKDTADREIITSGWINVEPMFPGGEEARMKFLADNLKYPEELRDSAIVGRVWIGFVIEADGSITEVKVLRSLHQLLDGEAVRVTKLMPKWKPGTQRGKPVRAVFRMPVQFTLTNEDNDKK